MKRFLHNQTFALRYLLIAMGMLLVPLANVHADDEARIKVMTQNQYLGADLTPLVTAGGDPNAFNAAMIGVLQAISASNYPERVHRLAQTIADSDADLVALQEMWKLDCIPTSQTIPDPCGLFGPAFNDHLQDTLDALGGIGADYYPAAQSRNVTVQFVGFPVPGLPLFLDPDPFPDVFVTIVDRDVILAHGEVTAEPVDFYCVKPSLDGCNFETVASTDIGPIALDIERGFVAVDAKVRGNRYRFVNTHLEVRFPDPTNPFSRFIQSVQATELIGLLASQPPTPDTELMVVGDINSAPDDPYPSPTTGPFLTPYQQFVSGLSFQGAPISAPYNDVWSTKYEERPGPTCCEAANLRNRVSDHDRRIDIVFSATVPDKIRARTLNTKPNDKTASGLWPSDHATVVAELEFDDDDHGHAGHDQEDNDE